MAHTRIGSATIGILRIRMISAPAVKANNLKIPNRQKCSKNLKKKMCSLYVCDKMTDKQSKCTVRLFPIGLISHSTATAAHSSRHL